MRESTEKNENLDRGPLKVSHEKNTRRQITIPFPGERYDAAWSLSTYGAKTLDQHPSLVLWLDDRSIHTLPSRYDWMTDRSTPFPRAMTGSPIDQHPSLVLWLDNWSINFFPCALIGWRIDPHPSLVLWLDDRSINTLLSRYDWMTDQSTPFTSTFIG